MRVAVSDFHTTKYKLVVRRIPVIEDRKKLFLDLAWRNEAEHGVWRACLIVCTTCATSTEALLTDERGSGRDVPGQQGGAVEARVEDVCADAGNDNVEDAGLYVP